MSLTSGDWKRFISSLTSIVLTTVIVLVASISLHEVGHLVLGDMLGCTGGKIILFDDANPTGPYTSMACSAQNQALLSLTGFPFPLIFAAAFYLLGGRERYLSFLFLGFGVLLGGVDILIIYNSAIATALLSLFGMSFICWGEIRYLNLQLEDIWF